jgi:hypothetical protein
METKSKPGRCDWPPAHLMLPDTLEAIAADRPAPVAQRSLFDGMADLERRAVEAHQQGKRWLAFYQEARDELEAIPAGLERQAVIRRLLALLVAGNTAGMEPPGDGWPRPATWELAGVELTP